MYVIMNKYNNVFYKDKYVKYLHTWTIDINRAKQFTSTDEAFDYIFTHDIPEKEILIVEI